MIQYQSAPITTTAPSCTQSIIGKLADTMLEMAFSGQNVTPETLESYGFSKDVVERYGARATALARRRSIRRIERYI
ncbi:hypothetical protein [Brucella anthropi]|uniref:Uncharacterized protein n=1 Tax=Brucella anthropi TaxID=529 RepID=A0A6L3Z546_BRUAN|nr:hypothetical protein [Brucella anthropi]KAB2768606.1 hypothetical protein F9L04_13090 [Brucella anthropi]